MGNHGYRPQTSPPWFFFFFFQQRKRLEEGRQREGRGCPYRYLVALVSLMLIRSLHLHKAVHYDARIGPPILLQHTAQLERNKLGWTQADGLAVPPLCEPWNSLRITEKAGCHWEGTMNVMLLHLELFTASHSVQTQVKMVFRWL